MIDRHFYDLSSLTIKGLFDFYMIVCIINKLQYGVGFL